jgi:hypothetical protein
MSQENVEIVRSNVENIRRGWNGSARPLTPSH